MKNFTQGDSTLVFFEVAMMKQLTLSANLKGIKSFFGAVIKKQLKVILS